MTGDVELAAVVRRKVLTFVVALWPFYFSAFILSCLSRRVRNIHACNSQNIA